jgi:hypothetical protein
MHVLGRRFQRLGRVRMSSDHLSAELRSGVLHVVSSGLCWSRIDPADFILPIIPDILSVSKNDIPSKEDLESMYFRTSRESGVFRIHLRVRLERSSTWSALRALGECALAPDEHAVVTHLLRSSRGSCRVLTDFPGHCSKLVVYRGKRYFDSRVEATYAAETLRHTDEGSARNSYVPRNGVLELRGASCLERRTIADLFESLGEWCSFSLNSHESSNRRLRQPITAPVV